MTTAIRSLAFLIIGIWLGYVRSENKFGKMVDDGQIVFKYEDEDESGWDGSEEGIKSVRKWVHLNFSKGL